MTPDAIRSLSTVSTWRLRSRDNTEWISSRSASVETLIRIPWGWSVESGNRQGDRCGDFVNSVAGRQQIRGIEVVSVDHQPAQQHPLVGGRHQNTPAGGHAHTARRGSARLVGPHRLGDHELDIANARPGVPPRRAEWYVVTGTNEVDDLLAGAGPVDAPVLRGLGAEVPPSRRIRSEEHTSELQSRLHLVC